MKDIKGFEGFYAITEDGRVWSYPRNGTIKTGKFLAGGYSRGYKVALLSKDYKRTYRHVHRIVAETFYATRKTIQSFSRLDQRGVPSRDLAAYHLKPMSFLRSMPNSTVTKRLCGETCECSDHRVATYLGLNALSGKDVEREIARRKKGRLPKNNLNIT